MIAVINTRIANINNIIKAIDRVGAKAEVTDDPNKVHQADRVILPGVGSFEKAAELLRQKNLDEALLETAKAGKPFLGICVGAQLLMTKSFEYGEHNGLDLIPGQVKRLQPSGELKVPHVGWDEVRIERDLPKLGFKKGEVKDFYFTHSYALYPSNKEDVLGTCDTGYGPFGAMIQKENLLGCQFHIELSGQIGLDILEGFLKQ